MERSPVPTPADTERRTGITLSLVAYLLWGAFPIYFKAVHAPPLELLANRVVWSTLTLALVLGVRGRWGALIRAARAPGVLLASLASGALLGLNWFVYIWAVDAGRVVDGSLGYFITPLVSVLIGVLTLGEALRHGQRLAIATAAAGVLWLTLQYGQLPWVGLALAATFGTYGALRKTGKLGAMDGLMLEQVLMFPLTLSYLLWLAARGQNAFQSAGTEQSLLLACSGPLSAVPLTLFAAGARRLPLSLVGVLQYVSPSLQLLLGVYLWHEPFNGVRLIGYALIWLALVIYSVESVWTARQLRRSGGLAT
jgi:chloramphenicol-sensitive protein RarD